MTANTIEIEGVLHADGKLILDVKPAMLPGRVWVALRPLVEAERLPDAPWLDDSIPAPFDLPRAGTMIRVQPRAVAERMPEFPIGLAEEAG